ncbi:hypothetical protein D3C87_2124470 [compost metagenome]
MVDMAGRDVVEAVDHAQQRRFAGARATDHAHHLPLGDFERHVIHGDLVAKASGDVRNLQHAGAPVIELAMT